MAYAPEIYTRFSSNTDNYFNLEDILASQEKVPVKTELPMFRLGFLNSTSDSEHILPGTKMELPFWLATGLCSRKRKIVSVEMPKFYRTGYREIFTADANVVDLHKMGPYFYSFGTKLLCFEMNESDDIAKSLLQVKLCVCVMCAWRVCVCGWCTFQIQQLVTVMTVFNLAMLVSCLKT